MLESLNRKVIVPKSRFDATFSLVDPSRKWLVYLKMQVNRTNVLMLADTGTTNSFTTPECTKKLNMVVDATTMPVKVHFVQ